MDAKQMQDQMKQMGNMSPDQLKQGMAQAQTQMGAQKQYYYNAAMMLKNEGNAHIKNEKYSDALTVYNKALDNIKVHSGDDVEQLRLSLLLNSAMCYLKQKDYRQTVDTCEQALKINSKSVKALFRRGLARLELGQVAEGAGDVKLAAKLSPDDKTIASELARVERECEGKGVSAKDIAAAEKKAEAEANKAGSSQPSAGQSSASSSTGAGVPRMDKALDELSKNPELISQATEAMKNMSAEDLDRMMASQQLPPGVDAATARKRMEMVKENPDMLKSAMESLKAMPEEQRKALLAASGQPMGGAAPDMSQMSKIFENPDAMKQAMSAMGSMGGADGPEADLMKKMQEDPEMLKSMTDMMKNIPPEQMQKMMELSMKGRDSDGKAKDPSAMMNNPEMMKAAEEMLKNISPEMLQSMAKASGMEVSDSQAKMISRFMPYMMKLMKVWGYVKAPFQAAFSPKGRIVLAVVIVVIAVLQHYYWSS
eukprot:TRINITY_DN92900_c0_g1_i1.p1 TRINITY_DN92900_c0_g1~~TRINITY_DN92900_c0_g1_i1.p1  ORF type:complete len:562 (+),score=168.81 TRINITY_DN92900_c0_g1_i1:242-1687(+)